MTRVAVHPSDSGGCGYYRLRWAAAALRAQGADVEVLESLPGIWERSPLGDRLVGVDVLEADVVVLQRVFRPELLTAIRAVKQQGVRVVIDVDDDFMALDPRHPVFAELHPSHGGRSWAVLREALTLADVVTVSTPALAAKYGGARARVIPNGIPRAYLTVRRRERPEVPVMGWTGSLATHVGDVDVLGGVPAELCRQGLGNFRAIGDPGVLDLLGIPQGHRQFQPGVALADLSYARAYADLDVAVVPLRLNAFNQAKSWLKMAEAAALGVPVVASPTAENIALFERGVGVLADRDRAWRRYLHHLLTSPDLREAMTVQGRAVMAEMTIEGWVAPMVWEAWACG